MHLSRTTKQHAGGVRLVHVVVFLLIYVMASFRLSLDVVPTQNELDPRRSLRHGPQSSIKMDVRRTQQYVYSQKRHYNNKADFEGAARLFRIVKSLGLNRKESVVLVGGTNNGNT